MSKMKEIKKEEITVNLEIVKDVINTIKNQLEAKEVDIKEIIKDAFRKGWQGNKHKDWNCEFYLQKYMNEIIDKTIN